MLWQIEERWLLIHKSLQALIINSLVENWYLSWCRKKLWWKEKNCDAEWDESTTKKYFIILWTKGFRNNVFSFVAIKPLILLLILSWLIMPFLMSLSFIFVLLSFSVKLPCCQLHCENICSEIACGKDVYNKITQNPTDGCSWSRGGRRVKGVEGGSSGGGGDTRTER